MPKRDWTLARDRVRASFRRLSAAAWRSKVSDWSQLHADLKRIEELCRSVRELFDEELKEAANVEDPPGSRDGMPAGESQ